MDKCAAWATRGRRGIRCSLAAGHRAMHQVRLRFWRNRDLHETFTVMIRWSVEVMRCDLDPMFSKWSQSVVLEDLSDIPESPVEEYVTA